MKTLILTCLAAGALSFTSCETDDDGHDHGVRSSTTTTEETTTRRPVEATTETRTIRSY